MNYNEEKIKIDEDHPQIYVVCISAYKKGIMHGKWIDVSAGIEHVKNSISEILKSSSLGEEWMIYDYRGFGTYKIDEYDDLDELCAVAELFQEYAKLPVDVISELINKFTIHGVRHKIDEDYIGEFDSPRHFAYNYIKETGLPEDERYSGILGYVSFDYEALARNLYLHDEILNFGDHYFWNR